MIDRVKLVMYGVNSQNTNGVLYLRNSYGIPY